MARRIGVCAFKTTLIDGIDQGGSTYARGGFASGGDPCFYDVADLPQGIYFVRWEFSFTGTKAPSYSSVVRTRRYEISNPDDAPSGGGTMYGRLILSRTQPQPPTDTYRLTVTFVADPAAGGAAHSEYGTQTWTYTAPVGTDVTISGGCTANPGYHFQKWTFDDGSASSYNRVLYKSFKSPVDGGDYSITCTAHFVPDTGRAKITAYSDPAGAGLVNGEVTFIDEVESGSNVQLTHTIASNAYRFVRWRCEETGETRTSRQTLIHDVSYDQTWIAECTEATKISIDVQIVPRLGEHGQHGTVTFTPHTYASESDIKVINDSGLVDVFTGSTLNRMNVGIRIDTSIGCRFVRAKLDGAAFTPHEVQLTTGSHTLVVIFGCDKLLHDSAQNKLLHNDNSKLIHCG